MVFWYFVLVLSVDSALINCLSESGGNCDRCESGYELFSQKCIVNCPTCRVSNTPGNCDCDSNLLFDLNFTSFSDLTTDSIPVIDPNEGHIGDFSAPVPFNSQEWDSPMPTGDRGFYFEKKSSLVSNQPIIPRLDNTILVWVKILSSNGNFITMKDSSQVHYNVALRSDSWEFTIKCRMTTSNLYQNQTVTTGQIVDTNWKRFGFEIKEDNYDSILDIYEGESSVETQTAAECFPRNEADKATAKWYIGSLGADDGFSGFFYKMSFWQNDRGDKNGLLSPSSINENCGSNEYYDGSCKACDETIDVNTYPMCYSNCKGLNGHYPESGKCKPCTADCLKCTGGNFNDCLVCSNTHFLLQGICTDFCPSGYLQSVGKCLVEDEFVFHLEPHKIQNVVTDQRNLIPVLTGKDNSFYPEYDYTDPYAARDRGYYFTGSAYMQLPPHNLDSSSLLVLSPEFTLEMWVKPYLGTGTILCKQGVDSISYLEVELENYTPRVNLKLTSGLVNASGSKLQPDTWNFLAFKTYFVSSNYYVDVQVNSTVVSTDTFEQDWYKDLENPLNFTIGARNSYSFVVTNHYKGFLWSLKIHNSPKTPLVNSDTCEGCTHCPSELSGSCLPNCGIDSYSNSTHCVLCEAQCQTKGCVRNDNSCNLCEDQLCLECSDFKASCTDCIENAEDTSNCTCTPNYFWDSFEERCFLKSQVQSVCREGYYPKCEPNCTSPEYTECLACHISCKTCSGPILNECTSCEDKVLNSGRCTDCSLGTFLQGTECVNCGELCGECTSLLNCHKCVDHSSLEEGNCKCNKGYYSDKGICNRVLFNASLTVKEDNSMLVSFSEPLDSKLTTEDIEVRYKNSQLTSGIDTINLATYLVGFKYNNEILEGDQVLLRFISELDSANNSLLETKQLQGTLNYYDPHRKSASKGSRQGQTTNLVSTGIVVSASLLSPSPSSLWALLNTLQILCYISLTKNPLTPKLRGFFKELNNIFLLPNFFEYLFDPQDSPNPHEQSVEYGNESNLFLLNAWEPIIILGIVLALWPFIKFFSKCGIGFIKKKFKKYLSDYKFGVFLRIWVQYYLELSLAAFNQVMSLSELTFVCILNFSLGCFFLLAIVFSPTLLLILTKKERSMNETNTSVFFDVWGSMFYEFRQEGNSLTQHYYTFFMLKRLLYAVSLLFLTKYPLLQACVNLILMIAFAAYLLVVRPYENGILQFCNIVVELGICLIFGLVIYFLDETSKKATNSFEGIVQFLVLFVIAVQVIGSFVLFMINVKRIVKKLRDRWKNKVTCVRKVNMAELNN